MAILPATVDVISISDMSLGITTFPKAHSYGIVPTLSSKTNSEPSPTYNPNITLIP